MQTLGHQCLTTDRIASTRRANTPLTVAVAGNPNCGKTTLFNALTGLRHKVGNYPGVTVERREARLAGDPSIKLVDLPGLYSLSTSSPDEGVARDALLGRIPGGPTPDAVLIVVDVSNLERNLYLASQILELGLPAVIACNKADLLARQSTTLDTHQLSAELGVPAVRTVAARGEGTGDLLRALQALKPAAVTAELPGAAHDLAHASQPPPPVRWSMPEPVRLVLPAIASAVRASHYADSRSPEGVALLLLEQEEATGDAKLSPVIRQTLLAALSRLNEGSEHDWAGELTHCRYEWLRQVTARCLIRTGDPSPSGTDRADRVLTHPVWGNLCFAAIMGVMFYSVFVLAAPVMDGIQAVVSDLQDWIVVAMPPGVLRDLLRNGIIAGVGAVLSFFPQIALLFIFIGLLEDSGYMARAALLMNRLMSRMGLHGKSFIPLLSSFACAVPGVLAARTIENRRDRLATILIAPFMSCSARLPIYTLLIAACLPISSIGKAAMMFGLYALGILAAVVVVLILKRTLLRGESPGFIIELPPYHLPRFKPLAMSIWDRCWQFLSKAGTVILAVTVLLWALSSFPRDATVIARYDAMREQVNSQNVKTSIRVHPKTLQSDRLEAGPTRVSGRTLNQNGEAVTRDAAKIKDDQEAGNAELDRLNREKRTEILRHSIAGRIGRFIEPAIRPLGFNWEIGVGIVASFAAREVFVGTMGIIYSVGDADETSATLREQMQAATWPDGRKVFTPLVAVSLMVFYVLSCQCVGTIAVVKQETRSWLWPVLQLAYMTAMAYAASLLIYQVGQAMGF
ncbi:MAG TPA: ferrous iron transport protein B [Phycisphaerae bacterium]|nr:ferrous iron transport protein B [Phycisphaerae bacterium]